jgi:hypothetical protein
MLRRHKLQPCELYRRCATKSSKRIWSSKRTHNRWLPMLRRKPRHGPWPRLPVLPRRLSPVNHPPPQIQIQHCPRPICPRICYSKILPTPVHHHLSLNQPPPTSMVNLSRRVPHCHTHLQPLYLTGMAHKRPNHHLPPCNNSAHSCSNKLRWCSKRTC